MTKIFQSIRNLTHRLITERGLTPEERRSVLEDLFVFGKGNQLPFQVRMTILLVLSTIIATAGLLADSAAVVIGAMLVAPMMTPVMAAAGAAVMGWSKRFYASVWLLMLMGVAAMVLSMLMSALSPEIVFLPEQVIARTRPTFFDLFIALAAGSAGAYTITRKETSSIPGVAVAVALLPPLASAGILITATEYELALRAVVLFLTNFVAMVLAAALTFIAVDVRPQDSRAQTAAFVRSKLWIFSLLTIAVSVPLWFYSEDVLFNVRYKAAKSEILQTWLQENDLTLTGVNYKQDESVVLFKLEGPKPPVGLETLYERYLAQRENLDHEEMVSFEYVWTQKITGSWPPRTSSINQAAASDQIQVVELMSANWKWDLTQYSADSTTRPSAGEIYMLEFSDNDKLRVVTECGTRKGKYNARGSHIAIEIGRGLFSGCRNDPAMNVFLADLERARDIYLEEGRLRIRLSGDSGIMFFDKKRLSK